MSEIDEAAYGNQFDLRGSRGGFQSCLVWATFAQESNQVDHELNRESKANHDAGQVRADPSRILDYLKGGGGVQAPTLHHLSSSHLVLIECQALIPERVIHVD